MREALIPLISAILAIIAGPHFIRILADWKFKQSIRQEGPQSHHSKSGTPTMGGWLIVLPAILVALAFSRTPETLALSLLVLAYAVLGFMDDSIGIIFKRNKGLSARAKMLGQILIAGGFVAYLIISGHPTSTLVPFVHTRLDLGWFYYLLVVIVLVSGTNAVNLTDGLDGLAASTSTIAFGGLCLLLALYAPGHTSSITVLLALAGGCLGFLWFNGHPAQVFMGDTGSLALGGALAGAAILGGLEFMLVPLAGIFVTETVSVMLQVVSFKTTRKRIFRMAPIHHHFELGGLKETKVVWRFCIVESLFVLLTIGLL